MDVSDIDSADRLIEQLQLQAHPEGGWYKETYRAEAGGDGRAKGTAILFLLKAGERSHWHRVDADEMWLWQAGDPLVLEIAEDEEAQPLSEILSADIKAGHALQGLVPKHAWQAAQSQTPQRAPAGYSLVSCVVVPGFDFAGFELAPPGWSPGKEAMA